MYSVINNHRESKAVVSQPGGSEALCFSTQAQALLSENAKISIRIPMVENGPFNPFNPRHSDAAL